MIRSEVATVRRPSHLVLTLGKDEAIVLMTALKWHHEKISRWFNGDTVPCVRDVLRDIGVSLECSLDEFREAEAPDDGF